MAFCRSTKRGRKALSPAGQTGNRRDRPWRLDLIVLVGIGLAVACAYVVWQTSPQTEQISNLPAWVGQDSTTLQASTPLSASNGSSDAVTYAQPQPVESQEFSIERIEAELRSALDQMLTAFPRDYAALHLAGIVYTRFKQTSAAEPMLRQSLDLAPTNIQVRKDLADLLAQIGREDQAIQILRQEFENGRVSSDYTHSLAEAQIRLGQLEQARETLVAGLKSYPESASNWLSLGETQLQLKDYVQAESSLRRALSIEPDNEASLISLSLALALQKKSEDAVSVRKRLDELRRSNQGKRKSFEDTYSSSFRRFASSTLRSMAKIYYEHRQTVAAQHFLERAIAIEPDDIQTLAFLASIYRSIGDFERGAHTCERLIQLQPEALSNYINLANLHMELGDANSAERALQLAAMRHLGQGRAHLQLAQFLLFIKRAGEAVEPARQAVRKMDSVEARTVLVQALREAGEHAQADQELAKLNRLAPQGASLKVLDKP